MSSLIVIPLMIIGAILALFIFWKLLKEDYETEQIFALGFPILLGGALGFLLTNLVLPSEKFGGTLILAGLFGWLRARRLKIPSLEVLEAVVPGILLFLALASGVALLKSVKLHYASLVDLVLAITTLVLFIYLKQNYRKFLWYQSGKIGFASLLSSFFYLIVRFIIALFLPHVLILGGRLMVLAIGGPLALASLAMLYLQSIRRKK
ncbi:hypothetical protein HY404_03725 [Candidatus Microgenomates bacterium]|nr:hypothetical protein [Candidatus Microgenomates bacterium]